ncbi:Protein kinase domain containing protein, putative [Plasmodium malariae]|uniref:non-specific serine/threonine protein kinase n=1 Tax=Plasmodium malariae TaxID=5858 RepID=A0A1C3K9M1_PLAMA|nr:Protein kinase domain containing protein, putative [Plasmodium malariae]
MKTFFQTDKINGNNWMLSNYHYAKDANGLLGGNKRNNDNEINWKGSIERVSNNSNSISCSDICERGGGCGGCCTDKRGGTSNSFTVITRLSSNHPKKYNKKDRNYKKEKAYLKKQRLSSIFGNTSTNQQFITKYNGENKNKNCKNDNGKNDNGKNDNGKNGKNDNGKNDNGKNGKNDKSGSKERPKKSKPKNGVAKMAQCEKFAKLENYCPCHKMADRSAKNNLKNTEGESSYHTLGIGTKMYSAPEQLGGHKYTKAVDMFSLGLIIVDLFTKTETNMERTKILCNARQRILPDMLIKKHPDVAKLCRNLLSLDYKSRFTSDELYNRIISAGNVFSSLRS